MNKTFASVLPFNSTAVIASQVCVQNVVEKIYREVVLV